MGRWAKNWFGPHCLVSPRSGVLYLTDGDDGGASLRKHLTDCGVSKDSIFTLTSKDGNAVETEDFLDPSVLVESINRLIGKFHGTVEPISKKDVVSQYRTKAVKSLYKRRTGSDLPKADLAYEILDLLTADPRRRIVEARWRAALKTIAEKIIKRFEALKPDG